jgi:hypothetical protein
MLDERIVKELININETNRKAIALELRFFFNFPSLLNFDVYKIYRI